MSGETAAEFTARAREAWARLLSGNDVVFVGNGAVPEGAAAEIDAAETVVRFNHCAGMGAGAGSKVSAVVIMPAAAYAKKAKAGEAHVDEIEAQCALIFGSFWRVAAVPLARIFARSRERIFPLCGGEAPTGNVGCDTGTRALAAAADAAAAGARPRSFRVFGFSFGEAWKKYLASDGQHYLRAPGYRAEDEEACRRALIARICAPAPSGGIDDILASAARAPKLVRERARGNNLALPAAAIL